MRKTLGVLLLSGVALAACAPDLVPYEMGADLTNSDGTVSEITFYVPDEHADPDKIKEIRGDVEIVYHLGHIRRGDGAAYSDRTVLRVDIKGGDPDDCPRNVEELCSFDYGDVLDRAKSRYLFDLDDLFREERAGNTAVLVGYLAR